jgi:CRISPR system Cascade subunit CasA
MNQPTFNLWSQPWITVEDEAGRFTDLSLEQTLLQAHRYRALYDLSPLVVVGLHRLLVAILQAALEMQFGDELIEEDLVKLWRQRQFPAEAISAFGAKYAHRFDLFSEKEPFMQSVDLPPIPPPKEKDIKFVARFLHELPTGSDIVHYYHGLEDDRAFCPKCAAKGLITLPAFAKRDGRGYGSSPAGFGAIFILPDGSSLFENLLLSLIIPANQPSARDKKQDLPWWEHPAKIEKEKKLYKMGYLQSLTLPLRRVRLHPASLEKSCTRCGEMTARGVRTIGWEAGERYDGDAVWTDPFVAYTEPKTKSKDKPTQPTAVVLTKNKAVWREYASLFLRIPNEYHRQPAILSQLYKVQQELERSGINEVNALTYPVRCIGFRGENYTVFEWLDANFNLPISLIDDLDAGKMTQDALDFATDCDGIITGEFNKFFKGPTKNSKGYQRLRGEMRQAYWRELTQPFAEFVIQMTNISQREELLNSWFDEVVTKAIFVFRRAAESLGDNAAALRQRTQAEAACYKRLSAARKKQKGV